MRRLLPLLVCLWIALPASAALSIDPAQSTLTPASGPVETLSGTLKLKLGAPPPLVSNTTFDVVGLNAQSSGGLVITLDPALSRPGAGVLSPAGDFLIPNLFLELDDGLSSFQLTVPDVTGSYGALAGCPGPVCLLTSFDIDTGPLASGLVSVELFAVPEPSAGALLALGLAGLATRRRGARC